MSVCFTAIVKNEAHIIRRCIDSTLGVVDRYCVVDTGSEDGTPQVIRDYFAEKGIAGEVIESTWKGFGESRTEAVRAAEKSGADYLLMMDADHLLEVDKWPELTADCYQVMHHYGAVQYTLPILYRASIPWHYEMPVHEYLRSLAEKPTRSVLLEGAKVRITQDGARSKNVKKFEADAVLLEAYCAARPDDPRPHYYLAQSYRDAWWNGQEREYLVKAYGAYLDRAQMNGWEEENFSAHLEAAKCAERLQKSAPEIAGHYLRAYQVRPRRNESLVHLARFHRTRGDFHLAHLYARRATEIARPNDLLFVEAECYEWRCWDELGVAAWYTGDLEAGRKASERALVSVPAGNDRTRIETNLRFFTERMAA